MLARLASLRLWLLVAMLTSAAIGLAAATILFGRVEASHEQTADAAKARAEARAIAAHAQHGATPADLAALQSVLVNDQVTVVRAGQTIYRGPARSGREHELVVSVPFSGGLVRLSDFASPGSSPTLDLALITGGVLALVIAAAIVTATVVTRAVSVPVQRAIDAAERVSHGELDARMGASGPEELVKLGEAFDDMAARLERADRDQRQFLADVAHEIATPINAVSGFALALADGSVTNGDGRAEARAVIESETRRLRDLLTDVRQLTHLDLAEGVRPTSVAPARLAEQLELRFRPAATAAGLTLDVRTDGGVVHTDPRLVEMIGSNLVSNAIRYTPAGGHVELSVSRDGDRFVLGVRDTGVGIAPDQQKRVFERLYRVDSTRDRATGGSGLGLAIAARAAANLGGHIELDSEPGVGSEFRLVIPVQEPKLT